MEKTHRRPRLLSALLAALLLLLTACAGKSGAPSDPDSQTVFVPADSAPEPAPSPAGEQGSAAPADGGQTPETPPAQTTPDRAETDPPEENPPEETQPPEEDPPEEPPAEETDWRLILVNADHPIPEGYTFPILELPNGHAVDERIYPELMQMFEDARAAGIYPLINESYRTAEEQQDIMDSYIRRYEASGMSHEEAVAEAHRVVAEPGTSEHQLGLALDIKAEFDSDPWPTWEWLLQNCWRYGFIRRYATDKEAITGYAYEPWHFRYVGVEAAKEIMEQGLCLEEYLAARETGE